MTPKNYDLTFHYFRAFAIVSVMLTHMWVGPVLAGSEDAAKLQDSLRLCLFHSATIYFVFISGYLFDFVNRRKGQFSPLRFYKSKIVNVFCPYFILSLLLLAAGWISHHWFGYDIPFINDGTPVASLWDVLRCLAYGSASLVPYWYIPFIMTVFSVGPLIFHMPTGLLQKILLPASVLPLMSADLGRGHPHILAGEGQLGGGVHIKILGLGVLEHAAHQRHVFLDGGGACQQAAYAAAAQHPAGEKRWSQAVEQTGEGGFAAAAFAAQQHALPCPDGQGHVLQSWGIASLVGKADGTGLNQRGVGIIFCHHSTPPQKSSIGSVQSSE